MILFFSNHLYFLAAIFFSSFWVLFFLAIKNGKKEMLLMSLVGSFLGPVVQIMHLTDWWRPNFLFTSFIKIEDVLFGFSISGVSSAVYSIIKIHKYKVNANQHLSFFIKFLIIVVTFFLLFGTFYIFHFSSFEASILTFSFGIMVVCITKPKLISTFFLVGGLISIIALPGYLLGIYINPDWIQQEWLLPNLSGVLILRIPVEELIWFFMAGMGISSFQEFYLSNCQAKQYQRQIKIKLKGNNQI